MLFNKITVKEFGDKLIYILPWNEESNKKISIKRLNKVFKKINTKEEKDKNKYIVLSKKLSRDERIEKIINEKYFKLFNGRWLFNNLQYKIIKYIIKCKGKELREQNVSLLINHPDQSTLNIIKTIAKEVKELRIVTSNGIYFKRIEQKLYGEMGIPISIVNNKRKSLLKSDIIINVDFSEKQINQYSINSKAIIVNIYNKIERINKSFAGININDYKLNLNNEYKDLFNEYNLSNQFDENILYESMIYTKDKNTEVFKRIENDNIEIEYLIGNNGKISEKEYEYCS
jgi:hypothetical protein